MRTDIKVANGLQPVDEFIGWVFSQLRDRGYTPNGAKHGLESDVTATNGAPPKLPQYSANLTIYFSDKEQSFKAFNSFTNQNADEAYNAVIKDAREWINKKERAIS